MKMDTLREIKMCNKWNRPGRDMEKGKSEGGIGCPNCKSGHYLKMRRCSELSHPTTEKPALLRLSCSRCGWRHEFVER